MSRDTGPGCAGRQPAVAPTWPRLAAILTAVLGGAILVACEAPPPEPAVELPAAPAAEEPEPGQPPPSPVVAAPVRPLRPWVDSELRCRDPRFASVGPDLVVAEAPPFLVVQQVDLERREDGSIDPEQRKLNAARWERTEELTLRHGRVLTEVQRRFREMFAEPCGLTQEPLPVRGQVMVMFWVRRDLDAWLDARGRDAPGFRSAGFLPDPGWSVGYVGGDALRGQDQHRCAGERVQKALDQDLAQRGSQSLLRAYRSVLTGLDATDDPPDTWRARPWFEDGMGAFFAGVEYDAASCETLVHADWGHGRVLLEYVAIGKRHQRSGGRWWSLADLFAMDWGEDLVPRLRMRFPETDPLQMTTIFRVQSWAFVHFCWHARDGKYRGLLTDYVRKILHGHEITAEATDPLGIGDERARAAMEAEYLRYWEACLDRDVGPIVDATTGVTIGWHRPDTTPPTGAALREPTSGDK